MSSDLAIIESREFDLPAPHETVSRLQAIRAFQRACQQHLVKESDYGTIPGTQKPTLLKPGAEKIVRLLGLADRYEITRDVRDWEKPFFEFQLKCQLVHLGSGAIITEGVGECNSMEAKYRYRWVFVSELDRMGISREARLQMASREINTRRGKAVQYRVDNEDIFSQVNTILKMAKKRALVDAALSAGRLSEIFTQDMEDISDTEPAPRHYDNMAETSAPEQPTGRATAPTPGIIDAPPVNTIDRNDAAAVMQLVSDYGIDDSAISGKLADMGVARLLQLPRSRFDELYEWVSAEGQRLQAERAAASPPVEAAAEPASEETPPF